MVTFCFFFCSRGYWSNCVPSPGLSEITADPIECAEDIQQDQVASCTCGSFPLCAGRIRIFVIFPLLSRTFLGPLPSTSP
ncbi:uncharacterized protein PgNI_03106 [Pyricularia grisea]|uniref:Uncharacterized protein n=1 Tax=Pyricularia grisea TaxID=148305 RepID=A0A6P8BDX6_PYRGI|nr:uncharacterized protein PgNI_03106 [Pyricularia grisea]TLD14081.1 hypothetical protein PgNI_03106 [Pyricularia grisea]